MNGHHRGLALSLMTARGIALISDRHQSAIGTQAVEMLTLGIE